MAEKRVGKWVAEQKKRAGTKEYEEGHSGLWSESVKGKWRTNHLKKEDNKVE